MSKLASLPSPLVGLVSWGVWPAFVIVLCQLEAARLANFNYPWSLAALTAAGTMSIYAADRFVERMSLRFLAPRHASEPYDLIYIIVVLTLSILGLPLLKAEFLLWFLVLGISGFFYLGVTVGRLPILFKELLGSFIFTLLVWGWIAELEYRLVHAFFWLGLANFLFASAQDRVRDEANGLRSLAVRFPSTNQWLARFSSIAAVLLLYRETGADSPLFWVALLHAFWPIHRASIDGAFLPLLAVPLTDI